MDQNNVVQFNRRKLNLYYFIQALASRYENKLQINCTRGFTNRPSKQKSSQIWRLVSNLQGTYIYVPRSPWCRSERRAGIASPPTLNILALTKPPPFNFKNPDPNKQRPNFLSQLGTGKPPSSSKPLYYPTPRYSNSLKRTLSGQKTYFWSRYDAKEQPSQTTMQQQLQRQN